MATLKMKCRALISFCPITVNLSTFFSKRASTANLTFAMWTWFSSINSLKLRSLYHFHIVKVTFVIKALFKEKVATQSVLGQILIKAWDLIFRVAIFIVIWLIRYWIWTLKIKVMPDSLWVWPETSDSEISFSGFPKNACQGCHIPEGAR